ncbi:MAG TPA: hypothetical protein VFQ61_16500, partial [Polyangiaceae bacterium]|nr:hypothetical protein [Polyangiaceae bacterium]
MRHNIHGFAAVGWVLVAAFGCSGSDGLQGTDGAQGPSGAHAVVRTSDKVDLNLCRNGGQRIEYGKDDNANGMLENAEVDGHR